MPSLGGARKASTSDAPPVTLRKQPHGLGAAHPNSRINAPPIGRKSAHSGELRRALYPVPDSVRAQIARPPLVTTQSYEIAGVAGFHRGTQLPVIVSSQSERRLKPIAHKNLGDPSIDHGPKVPKEVNASDRSLSGTGAKSQARRAKASSTQVTSSRKPDVLLNQHRNQVNSAVYASIVFGRLSRNQHSKRAAQSGNDEEVMPNSTNNFMPDRVPEPASAGGDDTAWKDMVTTFGALSLSTATAAKKRRLPFLRRIVRTSFRRRCQIRGLAVDPVSPQLLLLTIRYKVPVDLSDNEWDDEVAEYAVHEVKIAEDQLVCPLCDTLGRLGTKEILEAHLEWDHVEVEVSWRKRKDGSWELALELPGKDLLVDVDEWGETESSRSSSPINRSVRPWSPVGASPASETGPRERQTPSHETDVPVEHPVPTSFKLKAESSPTIASRTASLIPDATSDSIHQVPHLRDPLGPLGVYPYLPSSTDDDNDGLRFSCRPCGPRLFDLVARYPMSEYGLTSWSLLERDEELFEIDDVRDEEKAMQALWNRWILSRQRQYLLDPRKLVTEFVETFQRTITETAGWKGLRVWLLLLAKHKLLTGNDIVAVMGHYETLTGTGR